MYILKPVFQLSLLFSLFWTFPSFSFCGFYVAKGGAELFNSASQVVYVRDDNKSVISMLNDYQGDLKEFAMVIPVPEVLKKGQVNVGDPAMFKRIDEFTSPRIVEYFDHDPCQRFQRRRSMAKSSVMEMAAGSGAPKSSKSLGVKIEANYTVGEYDILMLSAKQSNGLETWLRQNNYTLPKGAQSVLRPYIKQGMKFFVAKVNLKEQKKAGLSYLRPIQIAFESEKFMLPIRLGMLNAKGAQDLIVYVLTQKGRVETSNYRTLRMPSDLDVPMFVRNEFSDFYKKTFDHQVKKDGMKSVFLEYFWDMGWCDPCASNPLSQEELKQLGIFWLNQPGNRPMPFGTNIRSQRIMPRPGPNGGAKPVKVTRLHLRYSQKTFPQDLMFQQTSDTKNFQTRYIVRHPWQGKKNQCKEAASYFEKLGRLQKKRQEAYANLTGVSLRDVKKKSTQPAKELPWWQQLWN